MSLFIDKNFIDYWYTNDVIDCYRYEIVKTESIDSTKNIESINLDKDYIIPISYLEVKIVK